MARFPIFGDTSPGDLRRFLDLSRTLTIEQRFAKFLSLNRLARATEWAHVADDMPGATPDEVRVEFARRQYGKECADRLRARYDQVQRDEPLPYGTQCRSGGDNAT